MEVRTTEVADGLHQLTTPVQDGDFDLGFNQYLLAAEEPLLFHTGMRQMFPLVHEAVATVLPPGSLRWISFGHVEADECGSMNEWLAAAPSATVVQGGVGCMVSIGDLADRPPRPLGRDDRLEIGGHRLRWIDTPHLPHGWDAGVLYDETGRTLFCGDLFTRFGAYAATTESLDELAGPALADEEADGYGSWSRVPSSSTMLRELAELDIAVLAPMHGPVLHGDGGAALRALADHLEGLLSA